MIARIPLALLLMLASVNLAEFGWIQGKGLLGQWLMQRSWAESVAGTETEPAPPWPGARTRPAARLFVPDLKIDRLVVRGTETPNLAWGPGIERGPNGHVLIAAHRDTHFRFLGDLQPGHRIELEQPAGVIRNWRVNDRRVVDSRNTQIDLGAPGPLLTLVTCWPLDAPEAGGPLRLVVSAVPAEGEES